MSGDAAVEEIWRARARGRRDPKLGLDVRQKRATSLGALLNAKRSNEPLAALAPVCPYAQLPADVVRVLLAAGAILEIRVHSVGDNKQTYSFDDGS